MCTHWFLQLKSLSCYVKIYVHLYAVRETQADGVGKNTPGEEDSRQCAKEEKAEKTKLTANDLDSESKREKGVLLKAQLSGEIRKVSNEHAPNNMADEDLKMQAPGKNLALHMGISSWQEKNKQTDTQMIGKQTDTLISLK